MKTKYIILLIALVLLFLALEVLIFVSPLGRNPRLNRAIEGAGVFVALLAAVIALSTADPRPRRVEVTIERSVDEDHVGSHPKGEFPPDVAKAYENLPDPIKSHRVRFKIINASGFTLEKPVLSFRLPLKKQHPDKQGHGLTFRSNLFNSQRELQLLEFADTRILSNSNLPYWNHGDDITIWIRMVLNAGGSNPFTVEISINSENASGVTKKVEIEPERLLNQ